MSSEDVIELGSSDEEPAPKRSKPALKPASNQMVRIPKSFGEVTIKPAAKSSKPAAKSSKPVNSIVPGTKRAAHSIATGLARQGITVKKVSNIKSQSINQNKQNGKMTPQLLKPKICVNPYSGIHKAPIPNKPLSTAERLIKSGFINVLPEQSVSRSHTQQIINPVKINNAGIINLPPNLSVTKTTTCVPILRLKRGKPQIKKQIKNASEVLTVELDNEANSQPSSRNASPQWYIKPEDHSPAGSTPTPEEENNKEPELTNLIEITIEDSPVKPIHKKKTHEVGAELSITIDDSPIKAVTQKRPHTSGSESEGNSRSGKEPPSKKKLNYPRESENTKTIEIEINPLETIAVDESTVGDNNDDTVKPEDDQTKTDDNLKDESSEKHSDVEKKKTDEPGNKTVDIINATSEPSEFSPVYQSFIDLCFKLENSDDMYKIVEKKIKGYYRQVPKEYTESEEFTDMVSSKILAMKAGPEKMYLYIKDIVDELNLQRKLAKSQPVVLETKSEEPIPLHEEEEERVYNNSRHQRQIRKLEKTIKKLHRAIQKLEEQEVDFEDEDDSVYLLTERYKERMVRVYAKFCQLSNTKMPSEPRIQIDARPGQPSGPAKRLEKWINKKVPIGTPLPFPDFHDVLRCVREANDEDRLGWNEVDIMEEARDLFTRCGRKLQRRRQENEWRLAASRIPQEVDPAEKSPDLKRQLSENKKIASQKETEIFNKYADRQKQLKLEAEEIGDKEAEESPVESEEEEATEENENTSQENKERRKKRLKKLLHKKSRKNSEEKANKLLNEKPTDQNIKASEPVVEMKTVANETEIKEFENQEQSNKNKCTDEVDENKLDATKLDVNKEGVNKLNDNNEDELKSKEMEEKVIKKEQNTEVQSNNENTAQNATETLTLSDDSSALESDIDELHLLQILHSETNEAQSSSIDSDDSDSPIAISDSLDSDDDNKKETIDNDDVISIENSSYSEDEGDAIHFINDDSSQDGTVNLISSRKVKEDQVADNENNEVKPQALNEDSVQLIHDDNSQGENVEQRSEDNTGRLVIEQIVSDHSNTASQDSDTPIVTDVNTMEVEFLSAGNLATTNEPVADITLASSDEEDKVAELKENSIGLEANSDCQKDNNVHQKNSADTEYQEVNADCQEYNADYREEDANLQEDNAVIQGGNADCQQYNTDYLEKNTINQDCQENNEDSAVSLKDNPVDEKNTEVEVVNADCQEINAVSQEENIVIQEDSADSQEYQADYQGDNVDCQETNENYLKDNTECQKDKQIGDADSHRLNSDCQEVNADCQEHSAGHLKNNAVYQEDDADIVEEITDSPEDNVDSQEENIDSQEENGDSQGEECVNLRDDLISIDETVVGNINIYK